MTQWTKLFDLATGKALAEEEQGPASRVRVLVGATLATAAFAAIYGLAAGSMDLSLAVSNVYKLPMVIILSAASAVPATLLAWKLTGMHSRATDLLLGLASGNFTATLVLAVCAPVVALYYHTSGYWGNTLAVIAAVLALGVGMFAGVRGVASRIPTEVSRGACAVPIVVMLGMQLAVMLQLIHVASPILPETTVFDGGVDAMIH